MKKEIWAIYWWDIEEEVGWSHGSAALPTVVSVGWILTEEEGELPDKGLMRLARACIEGEPGGVETIPLSLIHRRISLGKVHIPRRRPT